MMDRLSTLARRLAAILVMTIFMAGCGQNSAGNGAPPASEHVAIAEAYCEAYWQFRCEQITRCACGVESLEACVEGSVEICTAQVLQALKGATTKVSVDDDAVEECRSELGRTPDCTPLSQIPVACLRIPRAHESPCADGFGCGERGFCSNGECVEPLGEGEACDRPGLFCENGLRCEGTCVRPGQEGTSCQGDGSCASGLACFRGVCRPPFVESASCDETMPCGPGLRCVNEICERAEEPCDRDDSETCGVFASCREPTSRECRPDAGAGASCEETSQCGDGHWCDDGRCRPAAGRGEACSDMLYCASGLACSFPDFVCGDIPGLGDDCAMTLYGPHYCGPELGCMAGICAPLPIRDEPCTLDNRCAEPWGCSFERDGSFCRPRRGPGESCENDQICKEGTFCDYREARCTPNYPVGAECTQGNECGRDRACLLDGRRYICRDLPGPGQPCMDDCVPGYECVTVRLPARCVADVCLPAGE